MSINATFLYAHPQTEIANMIRDLMVRCRDAQIVSGFATPGGIEALRAKASAGKISRLVLGAATFKAFEALDKLIGAGVPLAATRVHLGLTPKPGRRKTGSRKHPFGRLRPMLHSKIYLFDMPDGTTAAFVGSHNLTGFALRGLNGEAGVLIEGDASAPILSDIRAHVAECYRQASPYDPTMKEAYARWYAEYLGQLRAETADLPRDSESRRTIIAFTEQWSGSLPANGERVYFELNDLEGVKLLGTEVHLHLFSSLPETPHAALAAVDKTAKSLVGSVEAIDSGAGSAEVKADWFIDGSRPVLKPTARPFRPILSLGKQQVRVRIKSDLKETYDYLFKSDIASWEPILGEEELIDDERGEAWRPVIGFREPSLLPPPPTAQPDMFPALPPEESPDSGSFILFSRKRRKRR